jgi:hypothetical protein
MKPTRSSKRLSDSQRLEIIAKLQKPNPPSKRAIAHAYCVSKVPLESYGATKTQYLNALSLFLNQLEFQPSVSVKLVFLN